MQVLRVSVRTAAVIAVIVFIAAHAILGAQAFAQVKPVTVVIVRHPESNTDEPTIPLTPVGRQRAELLVQTFRDITFTHIFASHTTRTRQTVEPIATVQKLHVVQLPAPGSLLDGQPVTDATSRQAAIQPIASALVQLPPGSVALVALNSDNIFGVLNRLGVPVAAPGEQCAVGSMCVPCLTKECFPAHDVDRLWYLVIEAGHAKPIVMIESRYGAGWSPAKQ